ncbi:hypothetical protein JOD43_004010 [Pullulanibacillus pueri]|uniref:NERD domain-containing protein n=1 Tax=Pullulanibacillus pueri TaxID=1437324 RepID=A0A8J3ENF1_9BACL|nr:hypothetical protein [Pullulanibacillus pueri]MBM7683819.1 hypothetical protein [Pullulanibacillus pueri]GGH87781.1 hypothetical protein GCM10007096_38590 [Pullulanibacillus pueri]
MAQLIQLERCISRYQIDVYRYAGRFIHQKKRRLEQYKEKHKGEIDQKGMASFYNRFFQQQLNWATTTATEASGLPERYRMDLWLRTLLKRLDETVLMLYEPVLLYREAAVPADIILVTPYKIWTLKMITGESGSVFQPYDRRQWKEIRSESIHYTVNPLISLQRTTEMVRKIFNEHDIQWAVYPCLLVPESYVEFSNPNALERIIDRTQLDAWFKELSSYRATLKRDQLHAAEILLKHSEVVSEPRT